MDYTRAKTKAVTAQADSTAGNPTTAISASASLGFTITDPSCLSYTLRSPIVQVPFHDRCIDKIPVAFLTAIVSTTANNLETVQ